MYRIRPRYDFSHALQAHNTNNKLIDDMLMYGRG